MDRRTRFFLVAALACLLMVPVGLEQYRDVAAIVGGVYIVLALLSALDDLGRRRR